MTKLPKFTLSYNEKKEDWGLRNDKTNRLLKSFETKEDATKGGALEKALGTNGGSVKIQKADGKIQEERTFPGSKDPKESKG
jgi:hypothetical protein